MKTYEEKQLSLMNKIIKNINQSSDWNIIINYNKNVENNDRYDITITKVNSKYDYNYIHKIYLSFDEFVDYICDFSENYFFLTTK
jgi:hypothetical protein